ncbi:nucleoside-triphosphatase [Metallosphaera sedula]|uniref:nucleoside-triphosphatase n=1 Tax=Metallosphaera sedula TaxID=43687 RepID=UPI0020C13EED|nr:nucleoside-triphosphatase [Metallosphaera sedula]BBL46733.1 nucleoside-triphosphatase [Metallosphaera sedula]
MQNSPWFKENPLRLFVTGRPGVGKTTLIKGLVSELRELKIAGFYTEEVRERGERTGFLFVVIGDGSCPLASTKPIGKERVGRYFVVDSLTLLPQVKQRLEVADLVIMDEIGPMEKKIGDLWKLIQGVLSSNKPVVASVHRSMNIEGKRYELTPVNRDRVREDILNEIRRYFGTKQGTFSL